MVSFYSPLKYKRNHEHHFNSQKSCYNLFDTGSPMDTSYMNILAALIQI